MAIQFTRSTVTMHSTCQTLKQLKDIITTEAFSSHHVSWDLEPLDHPALSSLMFQIVLGLPNSLFAQVATTQPATISQGNEAVLTIRGKDLVHRCDNGRLELLLYDNSIVRVYVRSHGDRDTFSKVIITDLKKLIY